jgi:hypothetical protein
MLSPAIESAAVVDPIRNRPKLARRRLIRLRRDQAAIAGSICARCPEGQPANAGEASSVAAVIDVSQILPSIELSLGGRRQGRPHRRTGHHGGFEPEVLAQVASVTGAIAGGAGSPALAVAVRCTLRGGCGLSERRAGKHRDQRERGDKGFHDTPLHLCGRSSAGSCKSNGPMASGQQSPPRWRRAVAG